MQFKLQTVFDVNQPVFDLFLLLLLLNLSLDVAVMP